MKLGNFIQWERKVGRPIHQDPNLIIRPVSRILPVWWRPNGGSVRSWPVVDITKIALAFFTAFGTLAMMVLRMVNTGKKA